jgi:hypothetical protein
MESGKLDEELRRMNGIVGWLAPGCLLLCNQSFLSTNEREGSEIALTAVPGAMPAPGGPTATAAMMFAPDEAPGRAPALNRHRG